MSRDLVRQTCLALPGAEWSDPWGGGHDAYKVGGKLFAVVGAVEGNGLSVKCRDTVEAGLLIDMGVALRAPYFHASWVRIPFGLVADDEMVARIRTSYRTVRAGLTKKVQEGLAPMPD